MRLFCDFQTPCANSKAKGLKLFLSVNLKIGPIGPKNRLKLGLGPRNSSTEKTCLMLR